MPRLFRQHYTKPVPEGAEIVTVKGKQHARFTDGGRTATAPVLIGCKRRGRRTGVSY